MHPVCARFASGDFASLADAFGQAGFQVSQPVPGVLQICAAAGTASATNGERMRLLVSVGVHGDETAPIEIVALLMDGLASAPQALQVDLMLVVGNIDAIAQGKRFVDVDLNRLFVPERQQYNDVLEGRRADQLMAASAEFFAGNAQCWHLDLHTAIRGSFYPTFAIVPGVHNPSFVRWLGQAGVQAAVLNPDASVTFSSFTSQHLGATSCTAELGRIGVMGQNDLSKFDATRRALDRLMREGVPDLSGAAMPLMFEVAQEMIKRSEAFQLAFDGSTENFTRFAPHTVIATDGDAAWRTGEQDEYVLFPNQNVRVGLRAGLLVRRVNPAHQPA